MKAVVLVLFAATIATVQPVPTQPTTKGLLGRSAPVAATRSLADVARQKATKPGTITQVDATAPAYQAPQMLGASPSGPPQQVQGGGTVTVNAAPQNGTTHAPPVVGVSVEQQRGEKR